MSRILIALLIALGLIAPASAVQLLSIPITTATTQTVSQNFQLRAGPGVSATNVTWQAALTYGSGGTTVDVYAQTSVDGGVTWTDVANFHFTTVAPFRLIQNVSSVTPVVASATPTDGAMTANTGLSGVFGNMWRVKVITTGTYAATTLRVDAVGIGLTVLP
jgi:hypothetical protein